MAQLYVDGLIATMPLNLDYYIRKPEKYPLIRKFHNLRLKLDQKRKKTIPLYSYHYTLCGAPSFTWAACKKDWKSLFGFLGPFITVAWPKFDGNNWGYFL